MATQWTTPKTWNSGDVLTATDLDTYVRDNTSWLGTDKPNCRVFNSAAISIPNNTFTVLTFDSERWDNQNMHSTVSSNMAGKYLITAHAAWGTALTNAQLGAIELRVNGSTIIAEDSSVSRNQMSISTVWSFNAADYVEVLVLQNKGGAINISATGSFSPEFTAMWLGN